MKFPLNEEEEFEELAFFANALSGFCWFEPLYVDHQIYKIYMVKTEMDVKI